MTEYFGIVVMFVFAVIAMATDHRFGKRKAGDGAGPR